MPRSNSGSTSIASSLARRYAYAPLSILALVFTLSRTLILARVLPTTEFNEVVVAQLLSTLMLALGSFGLYHQLLRVAPQFEAQGQRREAARAALTVIFAAVVLSAVVAVAGLALSSAAWASAPAVLLGSLLGLAQQAFLVVGVQLRARGELWRSGVVGASRGGLILVVTLAAALLTGSGRGALLCEVIVTALATWPFVRREIGFAATSFGAIARQGYASIASMTSREPVTLLLASAAYYPFTAADRWFGARFLSEIEFSQLGVLSVAITAALAFQSVVNASLLPEMARMGPDVRLLRGRAWSASRWTVVVSLAGTIAMIPAAPALYGAIVRGESPSTAAFVLVFAGAAIRAGDFWSNIPIVLERAGELLACRLLALATGAIGWAVAVVSGAVYLDSVGAWALLSCVLGVSHFLGGAVHAHRLATHGR